MYVTTAGDVVCKIILYGPPNAGRATFLEALHRHLAGGDISDIETIDLEGEEAPAFIWKSGQQVQVNGKGLIIIAVTLSGRSRFHQSRRTLVESTDGIIFVADTRRNQLDSNIDAMNDLMDHLRACHVSERIPTVIAYNRSDDPQALSTRQLEPLLNHFQAPSVECAADQGRGVDAVWLTLTSMLIPEAETAMGSLPQGPEPKLQPAEASGWLLSCHACGSMLEVETAAAGEVFTCGSCGASIQVVDLETGRTGPVDTPQVTAQHISGSFESQAYGLQSLPSPAAGLEALSPTATGTGSISAARPFELSGFDLLRELDSSPLGQRFRLYEQQRQRKVRAFRIDPAVVSSPGYRVQVEPYVRMAAKVRHPNVVPIIGLRWQGAKAFLISEDAANYETLTEVLARRRRLSPAQALDICLNIAIGLEDAARQGVVHGFLRPDVVLISPENHVLIDGLGVPKAHAHLIQALEGQSPSTEFYLAPEHLLIDAPSDIRSDLFLIGALLYRMVSAEGLVTGFNAVEALHRFTATGASTIAATAASLPREVVNLLSRLTAGDRRDRFQHYGEAIEAIERCAGSLERRQGSGPNARGQTGAAKRRTGNFARGSAATGTGQIRGGTGQIRGGTTTARRTPGGTTRATGTLQRGRDGATGSFQGTDRTRKRKKAPIISGGGLALIIVMLAVLIGAVVYIISLQHRPVAIPTYDSRGQIIGSTTVTEDEMAAVPPLIAAQRAVAAYAADPSDERQYQAARQAITQVTGQSRVALEQRLRTARETRPSSGDREAVTRSDPAPTAPTAPTTAASQTEPSPTAPDPQPTAQSPQPRPTATQLSARQQEELSALRRAQRYAEATSYAREHLAPGETKTFLIGDIRDEYIRTKTLTEERARNATSRTQLADILRPAQTLWNMSDDDGPWAERLLAQGHERLPVETAQPEAPPTDSDPDPVASPPPPSTPSAPQPPATATAFTLPSISPGSFTTAELDVDRLIVQALRAEVVDRQAIARAMESLPADSPNLAVLSLREQLWFAGPAAIQGAISEHNARLRVSNPIAGGQWDVVSADERGLVIRNPTGSSMSLQWGAINAEETGGLYQQLGRVNTITGKQLAAAAAINLTLGHATRGTLLARQARQANYEQSDTLERMITLGRDRRLLELMRQGLTASEQLDPFVLAEVVTSLKASSGAEEPLVVSAIAHFEARRQAILAGGATPKSTIDDLDFSDPDHRLAFPQRSGWMIGNNTYSSSGTSGVLQREDLGNAQSLRVNFSLRNTEGSFRIGFRGVEVIAQMANRRMTIRAAGANTEQHQEFAFAANTMYTLIMTYDPTSRQMQVVINRLEPLSIGLPRATSILAIATEGGAQLSLDHLTITRFGQGAIPDQEALIARQEALRSLGLIPYGATVKDPDSPAITIPEGPQMSGLGIPLRSGDRGVRFLASGSGILRIRISPQNRPTEGDFVPVEVPPTGDPGVPITVTIDGTMWALRVDYPDATPAVYDNNLPAGANTVVIFAEKGLTIHSTPEAIR